MRILRLKLVNFIGIKHGLGEDEIEIDFSKSQNKVICLFGGNGSGKSTILSQLHPFKESFDDRKTLILDGTEGLKEIDIESNGHLYEIVHIYAKTAQSFIKKDGVELNENGGVRTFEDIVLKELGISKDYFLIGKIGSNSRNFVDLTTSERKAYIGKFLNIEDILDEYKVVNDKLKALKKEINSVGNDLSKFKDEAVIKTEIDQLNQSDKEIDEKLATLYTEKGSVEMTISRDDADIGESSIDALSQKITEKQLDVQTNSGIKNALENELEHLDDADSFKEKLGEEISNLQTKIEVNSSELQNKNLLYLDQKNKIDSLEIELSSLGNPEDIENLNNIITETENKINELKEKIRKNPEAQFINKLLQEKRDIHKLLNKFINFTNFIEKYLKELSANSISKEKTNIEYFFDDDFEESISRQISQSRKVIEEKRKLLEKLKHEHAVQESYISQLENLKKRPTECDIDSCPFIKDAYEHRNCLLEVEKLSTEIETVKNDLELLETKAENIESLQTLYLNFSEEYKTLGPRDNQIYVEFIKETSLIKFINASLSEFQQIRQEYIENINNALSDLEEFLQLNNKLIADKKSKKVIEDSDLSLRDKYLKDIESGKNNLEKIQQELSEFSEKGKALSTELIEKQNLSQKYISYTQAISKLASASTMLSNANTEYKRLSALIQSKAEASAKLNTIKESIFSLTNLKADKQEKLTAAKVALEKIKALKEKLKTLNELYVPTETVATALSPTTGIPLIFIKTYLEETEAIANDLLNIAFDGDFQIKFMTNEKEFAIQVISKDNTKADIKLASQGEVSITTLSISLALIEQSIGAYNILCLDEIDGPLDNSNRSKFIDILNSQIEKLGIEQAFVISHNNAFDTAAMDLILLKGNAVDKENPIFMENKTIIYENNGI